jgi:hypothetical protein
MTRSPDPRTPPRAPSSSRREHTAADPSNVVTEKEVANEDKALPTQKPIILVLAFGGAAVALAAVILEYMRLDLVALIVAVVAVVMTLLSVMMAWGDMRAGRTVPAICLAASIVVLLVILFDVMGVDDTVRDVRQDQRDAVRQEPGATGVTGATTVDDRRVPADPADIVQGTPQQQDLGSPAERP